MAMAAVAAVGMGISVWGQVSQANAQAAAANKDADSKAAMADEVLARAKMNDKSTFDQTQSNVGNQRSQFAAGGVDVGSGTPLVVLENTLYEGRRQVMMNDEEAQFRAQQYLISGNAERDMAGQYQQAGMIGAAGTILTGVGSIGMKGGFDKKVGT